MKKILALILAAVLAFSLVLPSFAADIVKSSQTLSVDGKKVDCTAYNIDGYNYFKLRDLAAILKGTEAAFGLEFDAGSSTAQIKPGGVFSGTLSTDKKDQSATAVLSSQAIEVEGKKISGLSVYNIGGYNYFKLADLKAYIGFGLDYDESTRTVAISTDEGYRVNSFAKSYAEVFSAVTSDGYADYRVYSSDSVAGMVEEAPAAEKSAAAEPVPAPTASAGAAAADNDESYSRTNVQVDGIDEGDIVKTDGKYIYVLNGNYDLTVIRANGASSSVVSRTEVGSYSYTDEKNDYSYSEKYPSEMYVNGDRLAVISSYYAYHDYCDDDGWHWDNTEYVSVDVYDISNPAAPKRVASVGQDGYLRSSRLMDGKLYVITDEWIYDPVENVPETYVPAVYTNGVPKAIAADCIYIGAGESTEYAVAVMYDFASGKAADAVCVLGGCDEIYMNDRDLYLFNSVRSYDNSAPRQESVYSIVTYTSHATTDILRIALENDGLTLCASGSVDGYVNDQFSADALNGNLRLVTTSDSYSYSIYSDEKYGFTNYVWGDDASSSNLFVLDQNLNMIGSLTDLAEGEYVYSARFDGDIAYFCTYRNVDPLFTVDLSDPTAPKVLSALKISGFSEYLHNWTPGHLFGFGRETDEETGWSEGLKMVMFDLTDKTNVQIENTFVLDEYWSEALYNHKAFLIDSEKNLIGFLADDSYVIYSYSPEEGFKELITFYFDTYEWNVRGLYIGNWVYIVGSEEMMAVDMNTWKEAFPIKISE